MFLQFLRTRFQLEERLRLIEQWGSLEIAGRRVHEALPPPDKEHEAQHQLYIFAKESSAFSDLEPVILVNKTNVPFITSDNPAICMNKLYSQRYQDSTAGVIQSGTIACLPISPQIHLLAYDPDVYRPIGLNSVYEMRNEADVNRMNELQIIRASDALFFQDERHADYVAQLYERRRNRRRDEWSVSWTGIREGETEEFEIFRKTTPEDSDSLEPRIQSTSPILPAPSTWPSFLRYKMRPIGWTSGSVVGFIRAAHVGARRGLREVRLPDRIPRHHAPEHRDRIYQRKN